MKLVHRIHRMFGSVFALLLAMWFVSGAVMTFAAFPAHEQHERLASAPPLPSGLAPELPPTLVNFLEEKGFAQGLRPRLAMLEGRPTWVSEDATGVRRAHLTHAPWAVSELDRPRIVAQASSRTSERVVDVERLDEPDQWTVSLVKRGVLPLYRVFLEGTRQVYLSSKSGEILQDSDRLERALAWTGAIPHWLTFTLLRQNRLLWKNTVLVLSALGLVASVSGSLAGLRVWWLRRKKRIRRPIVDVQLRWHQALGLVFGLFVTSWLFSGALSLRPFDWTGDKAPSLQTRSALYGAANHRWDVGPALARCQAQLEVRELELTRFAGRVYAVCYDAAARTRIVDVDTLVSSERLGRDVLAELTAKLGAQGEQRDTYDGYYFPRKRGLPTSLPYWRLSLHDERDSVMYVDPSRALMAQHLTRAGRWERWLYHGLHSIDLPGLYQHRAAWRTLLIAAMSVGAALSLLGFAMTFRKLGRRLAARSVRRSEAKRYITPDEARYPPAGARRRTKE